MAKQRPTKRKKAPSPKIQWEEVASKVTKKTEITVSYDFEFDFSPGMSAARFSLNNGLKIVLMSDRRAPVFTYQTWFKVGSRNEKPGCTGVAHLFEHLMFKGTSKHGIGEFDREMESRGCETNAATWVDWTYYTAAMSNEGDNFEVLVDFEVDRMTGLLLDEETFRSEVDVVKNERRLCIDDSPSGALTQLLYENVFGEHPYSWPTLGYMEHLQAVTVTELKEFYRTYYAPNNATVVVVGDLNFEEVLSSLARGYGDIAPQPIPTFNPNPVVASHGPSLYRLSLASATPQMMVGFLGVAQSDVDFPALEILTELLVNGESSRLYRRLVIEEALALDISGYLAPFSERGLVEFSIVMRSGVEPEDLLRVFQQELDLLANDELSCAELEKAKNSLELSWLMSLKTSEGLAEALGHYESNFEDFSLVFRVKDAWGKVEAKQCRQLAGNIFKSSRRVVVMAGADETLQE
tara:strand:+ start:249 stop:1643 length:1395 start_codon:yes stop_codon:yes gene_type:complete